MTDDKDTGWVRIHRKIQDCWIWNVDTPFDERSAWIDLFMLANHKDVKMFFRGELITVKRGERITSIRTLANRWKWSRDKVSRFLKLLEADNMITRDSDNHRTLLSIVNYGVYQDWTDTEQTQNGQEEATPPATPQPHPRPQSDTNNNDNNDNNDLKMNNNYSGPPVKKEKTIPEKNIIPPTVEMVKAYCEQRNNGIDAGYFIDYYSARGWYLNNKKKMVDWHSAVGTWERNKKKYDGVSEDQNKESEVAAQYKDSEYYEQISLLMEGRE